MSKIKVFCSLILFVFCQNIYAQREGMSPLMLAIYEDEQTLALDLIEAGAPLDDQDNLGRTALMHAIKWSLTKISTTLIDKKANIHIRDKKGWNALHYAVRHDETKTRRMLLEKGADVNALTLQNESPLILAALGYDDLAMRDLAKNGAYLDYRNSQGKTAIMISDELKDWYSVEILLGLGASAYVVDETRLEWEIVMDEDRVLAFVNFVDPQGNNQIMIALKKRCFFAASKFISWPLNLNQQNNLGKTALMMMVENNLPDLVQGMILHGEVNLNLRDSAHKTALGYAYEGQYSGIIEILELAGANL